MPESNEVYTKQEVFPRKESPEKHSGESRAHYKCHHKLVFWKSENNIAGTHQLFYTLNL